MDLRNEMQVDSVPDEEGTIMIESIRKTRDVVIKHIMQRVCDGTLSADTGLRLITAFEEEYQLIRDSAERYQRACYQITDDRTVIIGGG
jgi:hypothetical protein